jgi:hypothetical protein
VNAPGEDGPVVAGTSVEIEALLEPGERLLWEGRPTRYRPELRIDALRGLCLLGFALCSAVLLARGDRGALVFGFVPVTVSSIDAFFAILLALTELLRFASWRAGRYGITDRRVLATGTVLRYAAPPGQGIKTARFERVRRELPLRAVAGAAISGRDLLVDGGPGRLIRFEDIDDPEAALSMLEAARSQGGLPPAPTGAAP